MICGLGFTQKLCKFAKKVSWNKTPVFFDVVAERARKENDHDDCLAAMTLFQLPASVQHARHQFKHALGQSYFACGHLHTCWRNGVFEMWRKSWCSSKKMRPNEKNRKLQEEKALEVRTGGLRMTYRCLLASSRPGFALVYLWLKRLVLQLKATPVWLSSY